MIRQRQARGPVLWWEVQALSQGWAALLEEVAAQPGSQGLVGVCQAEGVWGWGGRQCFETVLAWRQKGGACLGNRNKSNHTAEEKVSGSPGGVGWLGVSRMGLVVFGAADRRGEPWWKIPGEAWVWGACGCRRLSLHHGDFLCPAEPGRKGCPGRNGELGLGGQPWGGAPEPLCLWLRKPGF